MRFSGLLMGLAAAALWLLPAAAPATPFTPCGAAPRTTCVAPVPGPGIPGPADVSGKDYSHAADANAVGTADAQQNVAWDGIGGTADSFDYDDPAFGISPPPPPGEVDALANGLDALFDEVVFDASALLFSTSFDPNIYFEPVGPAGGAGAGGIWATTPVINGMVALDDVDGLEVWGADGPPGSDTDHYSLAGDGTGDSVFKTSLPAAGPVVPLYTVAEISAAIAPLASGGAVDPNDIADFVDVDGMMLSGDDKILFTIAPIPGEVGFVFDGGEIFIWDRAASATASFLFHGGHPWDTAFPVMATFGTASENVNALESVATPEPASLVLLGAGLASLAFLRRRRS